MDRVIAKDYVRFACVGALGFVINLALLSLLYRVLALPLFIAQAISAEIALLNNFILHNHWTYRSHATPKSIKQLLTEFHVTSWAAILGSALLVSFCVNVLDLNYVIALAVSSVIAMCWNYCWTKFFVWRRHELKDPVKQGA